MELPQKVLILSDSILKWVDIEPLATTYAVRGAVIEDLITGVQENWFVRSWETIELVIIHCGTNDVANKKQKYILHQIQYLIHEIKSKNRNIRFILSSILPRPRDFQNTNQIIERVNQVLKIWAGGNHRVHYLPSFRSFLRKAKIRTDQDLYASDGLHLNDRGTTRMARIIRNITSLFYQGRLTVYP
jgi:lysophospholipase L1-like esterase